MPEWFSEFMKEEWKKNPRIIRHGEEARRKISEASKRMWERRKDNN